MRVIKKGRKQKASSKELRCTGKGNDGNGCGATLLVEESDVFTTESHARDETTVYSTFQCPDCRTWTDVKGLAARNQVKPCYDCKRIDCEHILEAGR